jgi:hypothetical protein
LYVLLQDVEQPHARKRRIDWLVSVQDPCTLIVQRMSNLIEYTPQVQNLKSKTAVLDICDISLADSATPTAPVPGVRHVIGKLGVPEVA